MENVSVNISNMRTRRYLQEIPLFPVVDAVDLPSALVQVFVVFDITIEQKGVCT